MFLVVSDVGVNKRTNIILSSFTRFCCFSALILGFVCFLLSKRLRYLIEVYFNLRVFVISVCFCLGAVPDVVIYCKHYTYKFLRLLVVRIYFVCVFCLFFYWFFFSCKALCLLGYFSIMQNSTKIIVKFLHNLLAQSN